MGKGTLLAVVVMAPILGTSLASADGTGVVVPKLSGVGVARAYVRLHGLGLRVTIPIRMRMGNLGAYEYYIGRSFPSAGVRLRPGSAVRLSLRCGCSASSLLITKISSYTVPNFVGRPVQDAFSWISNKNLFIDVHLGRLTSGNARTLRANYRVTRESPGAGSTLATATPITLSNGTHGFAATPLRVWAAQHR